MPIEVSSASNHCFCQPTHQETVPRGEMVGA